MLRLGVGRYERVNGYPLAPPVDQPGVEELLKSKVVPGDGGGADGDGGGDGGDCGAGGGSGGSGGATCAQITNPSRCTEPSLLHSIVSPAAITTPSGPTLPL